MQVGQIVYKLQNYQQNTVSTNTSGSIVAGAGNLDMTKNLFSQFNDGVSFKNAKVSKLGVQAPPHTRMVIDNRNIQVGNTGVYELDDNIIIQNLKFVAGQDLHDVIIDFIYN